MASPQAVWGTPALDSLQAMVNLVLSQTGRYLKEVKGGGSSRAQFAMKRAIPAALDRFHDSLDELENELHRAQAVLRRDLALIQADRQKREQAEAAERRRLAAEFSAKKIEPLNKEPTEKEITMADADQLPMSGKMDHAVLQENATEKAASSKDSKTATRPPQPAPITTTTDVPERDPLFDGTPTTANPQETDFDFDSMFANDDPTNQSAEGSVQPGNLSNTVADSTAPDLDFHLGDDEPSLLRGLEDFANSGNDTNTTNPDFSMLDITTDSNAGGDQNLVQQQHNNQGNTGEQIQTSHGQEGNTLLDSVPTDADINDLFFFDNEPTGFEDAFYSFEES